ncbi:hypothetical protein FB451DRAFT_1491785 [Mycena latifolia]|nr:hypothetical protein FB451DRAFT_1491785 [Mycena latifolia]
MRAPVVAQRQRQKEVLLSRIGRKANPQTANQAVTGVGEGGTRDALLGVRRDWRRGPAGGARELRWQLSVDGEATERAYRMQAACAAPAADGGVEGAAAGNTAEESHVAACETQGLEGAGQAGLARAFIGGGGALRIVAAPPAQTIRGRVYPGMRRTSTRLCACCLDVRTRAGSGAQGYWHGRPRMNSGARTSRTCSAHTGSSEQRSSTQRARESRKSPARWGRSARRSGDTTNEIVVAETGREETVFGPTGLDQPGSNVRRSLGQMWDSTYASAAIFRSGYQTENSFGKVRTTVGNFTAVVELQNGEKEPREVERKYIWPYLAPSS